MQRDFLLLYTASQEFLLLVQTELTYSRFYTHWRPCLVELFEFLSTRYIKSYWSKDSRSMKRGVFFFSGKTWRTGDIWGSAGG